MGSPDKRGGQVNNTRCPISGRFGVYSAKNQLMPVFGDQKGLIFGREGRF